MRISDWSSDVCSSDLSTLARVRIQTEAEVQAVEEQRRRQAELLERRMQMQHEAAPSATAAEVEPGQQQPETAIPAGLTPRRLAAGTGAAPLVREMTKVGRNDPCPCGRGDRKSVVEGKSVVVSVDLGGRGQIK